MSFTIGSLFDGSGGFPLAAFLCGGAPVWASEVEPYPIAVTKTRFPYMKHLGSVTDIKGNEVEPVDVITFGSPCQDLSVAGKRAGLKHTENGDDETTRSGLFLEAVRIIKEMREATGGKYPRFALWENVPGAFSSNKGEDFRVVCEELIKVVEPTAVMPAVPQKGWNYADMFCGDGWSLAYRVLDSQHWGVPQRRRRIYLILDLGGERAGKVLFESAGLRGYFEEGRTPWKAAPGDAEDCTGTADCESEMGERGFHGVGGIGFDGYNSCDTGDKAATLGVNCGMSTGRNGVIQSVCYGISPYHSNCMKSDNPHSGIYIADTARTLDAMNCGYPGCNQGGIAVVEQVGLIDTIGGQAERGWEGEVAPTLKATHYKMPPCVAVRSSAGFCTEHSAKSRSIGFQEEVAPTLRAGVTPAVAYSIENHPADSRVDIDETGKVQCLTSRMGTGGGNVPMVMEPKVYESHPMDSRIRELDDVAPTVSVKWHKGAADTPLVCEEHPVCCLEGNGSRPSHRGDGWCESETMYTLNATEQHSVAYSLETFHCTSEEEKTTTLKARDYKDPCVVAYGVDCRNATEYPESMGAIQAAMNHNLNSNGVVRIQYIVRRLTPTECARLQGFPDRWATPDKKENFTDEEYKFWLNVRNTHAEINGKTVKDYTKDQMLTWYNKLHTDSAEYKLWGNGIALPTALYVMQGIADVMKGETKND